VKLWIESLNSDCQQFHQYQQNKQSPLTSTCDIVITIFCRYISDCCCTVWSKFSVNRNVLYRTTSWSENRNTSQRNIHHQGLFILSDAHHYLDLRIRMVLVFWRSNLEICWISYLMGIKSHLWLYKKKKSMKSIIIFLENNLQPRMLMLVPFSYI
jgi:queuine/archaeosine tRNA-ribosyltransferase